MHFQTSIHECRKERVDIFMSLYLQEQHVGANATFSIILFITLGLTIDERPSEWWRFNDMKFNIFSRKIKYFFIAQSLCGAAEGFMFDSLKWMSGLIWRMCSALLAFLYIFKGIWILWWMRMTNSDIRNSTLCWHSISYEVMSETQWTKDEPLKLSFPSFYELFTNSDIRKWRNELKSHIML